MLLPPVPTPPPPTPSTYQVASCYVDGGGGGVEGEGWSVDGRSVDDRRPELRRF